jgi:hypothetical protein
LLKSTPQPSAKNIIRADVSWNPTQDEQIRQGVDNVGRVQLSLHLDRQAFAAMLIKDIERPERFAFIGAAMDKVIGPNMVTVSGTQPNKRPVIQPETPSLWLFSWNLQPLSSP